MSMPWTMREPVWLWGDDGALTDLPSEQATVHVLAPELRARQAPGGALVKDLQRLYERR
jgi:hypothetical protein